MAKRFSDSDKWKKPFMRGLQTPYKLFWMYILDDCDHAGIWQVDIDVANLKTGENLNLETAIQQFGNKIEILDDGEKWYVKDFVDFQYGVLNPANKVHESVIKILNKNKIKPLVRGMDEAKDKDKDKDKDIIKEKEDEFLKIRTEAIENLPRDIYDKITGVYKIKTPIIYTHNTQFPLQQYDLVEFLADSIENDEWKQNLITRFGGNKKFSKAMVDYVNKLKTGYEYKEFKNTHDFRKYFSNWFNLNQEKY